MLVIGGGFAVVLVAAFAVLMLAIQSQRSAAHLAVRSQQALTAGEMVEKNVVNLDNGVRGYVATGRQRALQPYQEGLRLYPGEMAALRSVEAGAREQQRTVIRRIAGEVSDYISLWAVPLLDVARENLAIARSQLANVTGAERIDAIRADFARLYALERGAARAAAQRADHRSTIAMLLGGVGILLVLLVAIAYQLFLRRSIIRPVERVAAATETVAAGDLEVRVPSVRRDEIGTLARGFNAMTASLARHRAELDQRTAELERSNRDLQDFASVAAHDIQGPLTTISMFAEALDRRLHPEQTEERQLTGHIGEATGRLRSLVRDLLAYAKVNRRPLRSRAVELDAVLEEALANLAGPIDAAGAEVVTAPLPAVHGDPGRLCQVVQNLLSNAIKFSDADDPRVEVTGERVDGRVRVSISDNGIGFQPEEAERIFRPFHRLEGTDAYEGSGIGLAICERIVSQHGGRIWAEGRPGEGATFHVELPASGDGRIHGEPAMAAGRTG